MVLFSRRASQERRCEKTSYFGIRKRVVNVGVMESKEQALTLLLKKRANKTLTGKKKKKKRGGARFDEESNHEPTKQ